jgi:hypothetical protein
MGNGRTVLSPVQADGVWRVQITWAHGSKHLFGKFGTREEAERWSNYGEHAEASRQSVRAGGPWSKRPQGPTGTPVRAWAALRASSVESRFEAPQHTDSAALNIRSPCAVMAVSHALYTNNDAPVSFD